MKIKQLVSAISCATILVGCGSGVNSSVPSQNIDLQAATKAHAVSQSVINDNLVFADSLGVLPLSEVGSYNYLFRINNTSSEKYSLVSLSLNGKSGEAEVENELLSASTACSILDAYSSCSIQLTPKTTKSANTLLIIKLKDSSGKIKELHQMVRMSDSIFSADGIAFANDLHQVVTANGNYSIALPVILSADFDDIKVANGSLQCDGGYYKGNACTYLISGKSLSDNSIVSAEIIGYRAGVEVAKVSQDILVKTTAQASLLVSQGSSNLGTSEMVVYNNGNTAAHGIKLLPDAQLKLVSGAECLGKDLPAHSACTLSVNNSSESGGYATLSVRAADMDDITSTQIRNVISREKVDLSFSATGNLHNVLINTVPATQTVTIKNTSDRQLRNFNIQLASIPATPGLKIDSHNCTNLAKNQTCSVVLSYKPTAIVSNSVNLAVIASYTDDNNQTSQLARNYRVDYSSIKGAGVLSSSEFNDFEIVSDGASTQRQTFRLSNTKTGIDTKLIMTSLETTDGLALNNGTCAIDKIIKGGKDCSGSLTYGVVNKPAVNQTNRLKYSYSITTSNSNIYTETSNTFKLNAKVYAANIEATDVTVTNPKPLAFEGTGDKDKPYKFIALKGRNPLVLNYTFTNKGNAPAKGFKITGVDNKLISTTGTCSLSGQDLKPNTSCNLKVVVPAEALFATNAFNHTSISDLALVISYRYSDQSSDLNTEHAKLTKHIQFTRNWANVQYSNVTVTEDTAAWNLFVTATHSSVDKNLTNDVYPITITPTAPSILGSATVSSCQISKEHSSCVAKVSFPKTNFPVSSENYNINLEARGRSLDGANAVFGQIQFALLSSKYLDFFNHQPSKYIAGHNHQSLYNVNREECANQCLSNSWCQSFDYANKENRCDLSKSKVDGVNIVLSSSDSGEYDHYERLSFLDLFYHHPNKHISGHNHQPLYNVSREECANQCLNYSWCQSFDYVNKENRCDLSRSKADGINIVLSSNTGEYDHYERPDFDAANKTKLNSLLWTNKPNSPDEDILSSTSISVLQNYLNNGGWAGIRLFPNNCTTNSSTSSDIAEYCGFTLQSNNSNILKWLPEKAGFLIKDNGVAKIIIKNKFNNRVVKELEVKVLETAVVDTNKYYYIKNYNQNLYFNEATASNVDGAPIINYPMKVGTFNSQFRFIKNKEGAYNIIARHSGKGLHVKDMTDAALLTQYSINPIPNTHANASFDIFYEKDKIKFKNRSSGKCLQSGLDIRQYTCSNVDSQLWELVDAEPSVPANFAANSVKIQNAYTQYFAGTMGLPSDSAVLSQYNAPQKFNIKHVGEADGKPIFKIFISLQPNLLWENNDNYIRLKNASGTSDSASTWWIYEIGNGTYTFVNRGDKNKTLDSQGHDGCGIDTNVRLKLRDRNLSCGDNGASQKWRIIP